MTVLTEATALFTLQLCGSFHDSQTAIKPQPPTPQPQTTISFLFVVDFLTRLFVTNLIEVFESAGSLIAIVMRPQVGLTYENDENHILIKPFLPLFEIVNNLNDPNFLD